MKLLVTFSLFLLWTHFICECIDISRLDAILDETSNLLDEIKNVGKGVCSDKASPQKCQKWKDTNRCDVWFFYKQCKKTCNGCKKIIGVCSDKASPQKCQKWKDRNHCNLSFAYKLCKKTCNHCGNGTSSTAAPTSATNPSTVVTNPSTVVTNPSTVVTNPSTVVTNPSTVVTNPSTVVTNPSTVVTNPSTVVTNPSTVVTNPPTSTSTSAPSTGTVGDPIECTDTNKGHCECGDTSKGFHTYTFEIDGVKRCFTVYRPPSRASEQLPVVLSSQCYGKDSLGSLGMKNEKTGENEAAKRYGFSRIGLSTPDGYWTFGNDNVVNDDNPMPCSDSDSKDIPYIKTVFKFIESHPDKFDSSKVYAEGFSQNSMFSAYIGFCFSEKVVGIWQGGSGMSIHSQTWSLPGCQVHCRASVLAEIGNCRQCNKTQSCTECQYWPIYPCYQPQRAMIDCLAEYDNDGISAGRNSNPDIDSTSIYMYERLVNEGHDPRLLRFSPSTDGTVSGGHTNPQNTVYWQVGCLGIKPPCNSECESEFIKCVNDTKKNDKVSAVEAFEECINEKRFIDSGVCTEDCAPTLEMLKESEKPTILKYKNFGAADPSKQRDPKPASSKCHVKK